ncbi:MAG: hypothetical protein IJ879_07410 [Muribaculaceae bacterium]|nr:hypothetical protein [Muribaculaceae bacterium]
MKKISLLSLCLMLFSMVFVSCADHDVNYYVEDLKGEMPQDIGGGMKMTDVSIVDNFVQIDAVTDESELDLSSPVVGMVLPAVAESIKAEFFSELKDLMQACSNEGKGFRVMLKGEKSGNMMPLVEISPEEMNEKFPPQAKE